MSDESTPRLGAERAPIVLEPDGVLDGLLSLGLWAAGVSWLVPMMGLQMALHRRLGPERIQWLERLYTRGQVLLTGSRWRAVDPAIDPARPYLFFQNHVNHLDHCTMYCATPHFKQGVELEEHFRYPVYGVHAQPRHHPRCVAAPASDFLRLRDDMKRELDAGRSLLVFPEGTRTLTGHLGQLQPGVFRIAQALGAPIVPVTVTGMYRVMRKGSLLIRPGHEVTVYCDAPIETAGTTRSQLPELMARVRSVMTQRLDDYWVSARSR